MSQLEFDLTIPSLTRSPRAAAAASGPRALKLSGGGHCGGVVRVHRPVPRRAQAVPQHRDDSPATPPAVSGGGVSSVGRAGIMMD